MNDGKTTAPAVATATTDSSPGTIEPGRGYRSFAQMPEALLLDQRVPHGALRLWGILDRQARGRPAALDSLTKLAAKMGCSQDTIRRALAALVATGWLDVQHIPGRTSRYLLNYEPPPTPVSPNGGPSKSARGRTGARTPLASLPGHTRAVPIPREVREGEGKTPPPEPPPTAKPPTYLGRCPAHGEHPKPPPCGPCADARRVHQAAEAAAAADAPPGVRCPVHLLDHHPAAECRSCRADRLAAGVGIREGSR